jgi:acyl-CoA thioester hydrolase
MATHLYRCPLRWADVDSYGIVNNVAFLRLLEEARVDFIWRVGASEGVFRGGSVVVRHSIEYKRPLLHQLEPIEIEMWVTNLQAATVAIDYEVKDDGKTCALASTTLAAYNYEKRAPRRLTEAETAFFQQYIETRKAIS